jgi:flagellar motility protein MotE (MotC chaperone)
MRTVARWFLVAVLVLDAAFVALVLSTSVASSSRAEPSEPAESVAPQPAPAPAPAPAPTTDALQLLGRELSERAAQLERRENELEELLRGSEVLRRAGLVEEPAADPAPAPEPVTAGVGEAESPVTRAAFLSLQRAYENMEPDSAARAIAELAARDKEAVVELLLGWKPRTSGAILDALTQADPVLAADLSYEVWKLDRQDLAAARQEPPAAQP